MGTIPATEGSAVARTSSARSAPRTGPVRRSSPRTPRRPGPARARTCPSACGSSRSSSELQSRPSGAAFFEGSGAVVLMFFFQHMEHVIPKPVVVGAPRKKNGRTIFLHPPSFQVPSDQGHVLLEREQNGFFFRILARPFVHTRPRGTSCTSCRCRTGTGR